MTQRRVDVCPCCHRRAKLTFHHLIPKKMHRRPFFRKNLDKEKRLIGIMICRQCHDGIHRLYDEMTLAKRLNSLEAILDDDVLSKHFRWVGKQQINVE